MEFLIGESAVDRFDELFKHSFGIRQLLEEMLVHNILLSVQLFYHNFYLPTNLLHYNIPNNFALCGIPNVHKYYL